MSCNVVRFPLFQTNSTNIFMIKDGVVSTPYPKACLPGITRGLVIEICENNNIPVFEKDISITELYNADQVFTTGTMGELAKVIEIDNSSVRLKIITIFFILYLMKIRILWHG